MINEASNDDNDRKKSKKNKKKNKSRNKGNDGKMIVMENGNEGCEESQKSFLPYSSVNSSKSVSPIGFSPGSHDMRERLMEESATY